MRPFRADRRLCKPARKSGLPWRRRVIMRRHTNLRLSCFLRRIVPYSTNQSIPDRHHKRPLCGSQSSVASRSSEALLCEKGSIYGVIMTAVCSRQSSHKHGSISTTFFHSPRDDSQKPFWTGWISHRPSYERKCVTGSRFPIDNTYSSATC